MEYQIIRHNFLIPVDGAAKIRKNQLPHNPNTSAVTSYGYGWLKGLSGRKMVSACASQDEVWRNIGVCFGSLELDGYDTSTYGRIRQNKTGTLVLYMKTPSTDPF